MSEMSKLDHAVQCRSFASLLDGCLMLEPSRDELLIIYDESFFPYCEALQQVVRQRDISATYVFLPISYQVRMIERARSSRGNEPLSLPRCLAQAIFSSTAILNLLNGDQETVRVRVAVLEQSRPIDCRLAHIPGIDSKVLSILSDSPIDAILRSSELLAWALGEACAAEIVSYDAEGGEYHLFLDLNGWDNEPIMSPGVIFPGSWGNAPPGETFCCPDPEKVNGEVFINGSVPDHVIGEDEGVLLTFESGRLTSWAGSPGSRRFFDEVEARSVQRRDRNWNVFSELGIGLNPAVDQLTGNSLFDEKAQGTIHVAIGSNMSFGHHVRSDIHADLVTWRPTLLLDGRVVMDHGELHLETVETEREHLKSLPPEIRPDVKIFLREGRIDRQDGQLKRVLAKANRIGYVAMAGSETGRALAELAEALTRWQDVTFAEFIDMHGEFGGVPTPGLLGLLDHYRVLGFSGI